MNDYIKYALDNLRHRKLRSWLTMIGIFIGIASIVALIGLGEGLRETVNSQFGFLGTNLITVLATGGIGPPGTGVTDPLSDKELKSIQNIQGVEGATGRLFESGKLTFNRQVGFGIAISISDGEGREIAESSINMEAEKGRLLEDGDSGVVFLGHTFSEEDNGFGKPILPGSKVMIQDEEFKVIGIMEKKGNFQVDSMVLMNEQDLRDLMDRQGDDYDQIIAEISPNTDIEKVQLEIEKRLRNKL